MPSQLPSDRPSFARDYLAILWRRKFAVILGLLLGLGAGAAYYMLTPLQYSASGQILIPRNRPEAVPTLESVANQPVEDFVSTQQGILRSPLVIDLAMRDAHLSKLPTFAGEENVLEAISKRLSVTRNKDSTGQRNSVLTLTFKADNKEDGVKVLDAIFQAYQTTQEKIYADNSENVVEVLNKAQEVMGKDLDKKWRAYEEFRKTAPLAWKGKDGISLQQERLQNLEAKRSSLLLRKTELQSQLQALEKAIAAGQDSDTLVAQIQNLSPRSDLEIFRQTSVVKWQGEILTLSIQEQKLLEKYGPKHPEVQVIRENLKSAEKFLEQAKKETEGRVQSMKLELEFVTASEESLRRLVQEEREEARQASQFETRDEKLRKDIAQVEPILEILKKRLQEASLATKSSLSPAQVIAKPGSEGVRKVQPSGLIAALIALVLGSTLAFTFMLMRESSDRRFNSPRQMEAELGLPMLGQIAATRKAKDHSLLAPQVEPKVAEAYREVREALQTRLGNKRVVAVTSLAAGTEKTPSLLALNLAVSSARTGKSVLLVDAHCRDPRLHLIFGLSNKPGLSELVRGNANADQVVQATSAPNLSLLPAGSELAGGGDLFASQVWEENLRNWAESFDLVILDGAPIQAGTEATALAARADGVLLEIPAHSPRTRIEQSMERLESVQAHPLGFVMRT